jgi:hypothetical protein
MGGMTYDEEHEDLLFGIEKSMNDRTSKWNQLFDSKKKPSLWRRFVWKWNKISYFRYEIKYFIQTIFRGYSDRDCWNIDYYVARKMEKILKRFRKNLHGYPSDMCNHSHEVVCEDVGCIAFYRWQMIIDKMILAFHYIVEDEMMYDTDKQKAVEEGLDLFRKHFFSLWD